MDTWNTLSDAEVVMEGQKEDISVGFIILMNPIMKEPLSIRVLPFIPIVSF